MENANRPLKSIGSSALEIAWMTLGVSVCALSALSLQAPGLTAPKAGASGKQAPANKPAQPASGPGARPQGTGTAPDKTKPKPPAQPGVVVSTTAPTRSPLPPDADVTYLRTADSNQDGWLSLEELEQSFGIDRDEFQLYDPDRDGRVTQEEFSSRFDFVVEATGWFRPPKENKTSKPRLPTSTVELTAVYDYSGDGALDVNEIGAALVAFARPGLSRDGVLALLDRDQSRKLRGEEVSEFFDLLTNAETEPRPAIQATSIEELFGKLEDRGLGQTTQVMPPRIAGPVPSFRRLDLNGNGQIELVDLEALQAPLILRIRPSPVLAAIDQDGNGSVSPEELAFALGEQR